MNIKLVSDSWDHKEKWAIKNVIKKGRYTMGPYVSKFEKLFSKKFNRKYSIMVNSGSSANLLSIASLFYKKKNPLKPGDEVIVPALAWSTTYFPLKQYNLKIRLCDVDLDTLNYDIKDLKKKITNKTKLIVGVSILGNPAQLDILKKICNKKKIYLFEDNCESLGAKIKKRLTGTFGDLSTSSFFFSHHISTIEGGMITTNNKELYDICKSLRAHGWTRDLENSKIFKKNNDEFYENYRFILPGYNVRPQEINGAIGIEQIKKFEKMISTRRKNAKIFKSLFKNDERFIIQKETGSSSWFAFTMIVNPKKIDRLKIFKKFKKNKIDFRMITGGNIASHDVIKHLNISKADLNLPNANYIHRNGFFIGNHPRLIEKELKYLKKTLEEV
tara:strand:- start:2289 stop:3449 length:1161 start_codon:yes stop_codon:yes gene_type:complete